MDQQEREMSWSRASGRGSGPEADTEKDGSNRSHGRLEKKDRRER